MHRRWRRCAAPDPARLRLRSRALSAARLGAAAVLPRVRFRAGARRRRAV